MIPYEQINQALNGHGAKFASLGLLKPVIKDGVAYVDEKQWEALCARIVPGERRRPDWLECQPERDNPITSALRRLGARFTR